MSPANTAVVDVLAPARWRAHAAPVRRAARVAARMVLPPGTGLCVQLVDDATMLALQRDFRGKEGLTDVLSFPDDTSPGSAGDVAICVSVAQRQARELGHPLRVELVVLVVHAVMHLWGLDHERGTDEARLQAEAEMSVLSVLGVPVEAALARRGF